MTDETKRAACPRCGKQVYDVHTCSPPETKRVATSHRWTEARAVNGTSADLRRGAADLRYKAAKQTRALLAAQDDTGTKHSARNDPCDVCGLAAAHPIHWIAAQEPRPEPVAWVVATPSGDIWHLAKAAGWQVDAVMTAAEDEHSLDYIADEYADAAPSPAQQTMAATPALADKMRALKDAIDDLEGEEIAYSDAIKLGAAGMVAREWLKYNEAHND
jgi:ribosomal protein L37E